MCVCVVFTDIQSSLYEHVFFIRSMFLRSIVSTYFAIFIYNHCLNFGKISTNCLINLGLVVLVAVYV